MGDASRSTITIRDILFTGVIVLTSFILIVLPIIHVTLQAIQPEVTASGALWIEVAYIGMTLLGLFMPVVTRLSTHMPFMRSISITLATISLVLPYLGPPLYVSLAIYEILNFTGSTPFILVYLIMLIFSLGELLCLETRPHIIKSRDAILFKSIWGTFSTPNTYLIIPYYITLLSNLVLLGWLFSVTWILPITILFFTVLYAIVGPLPMLWYYDRERTSRGYVLTSCIPVFVSTIYHIISFSTSGYHPYIHKLLGIGFIGKILFMTLHILAMATYTSLVVYTPKYSHKNAIWRITGIICFYIVYILNGPWWWLMDIFNVS